MDRLTGKRRPFFRHGRTCSGHPCRRPAEAVERDARNKSGHDGGGVAPERKREASQTCRQPDHISLSCFVMRAGGTLCDMSWDVMIRMHRVHMLWPVRAWAPGIPSRFPGFCIFGMGLPFQSVFVPFFPPPAAPGDGTLIRAYPARAPAPVGARFAAARIARLIARARKARHRAHVSRPFRGSFFAPARNRSEAPPDGASFPRSNLGIVFYMSIHISDISQEMKNKSLYRLRARLVPVVRFRRRAGRPGHACRETGEIAGRAVPQAAQTG